jgi:hypothetical protein
MSKMIGTYSRFVQSGTRIFFHRTVQTRLWIVLFKTSEKNQFIMNSTGSSFLTNFFIRLLLLLITAITLSGQAPVDLTGTWQVELDPRDEGIDHEWYMRDLSGNITLPGSLDQAGLSPPNHNEFLNRLTPEHRYIGVAWFRKEVDIPEQWAGSEMDLFLEQCHWTSKVWINGRYAGGGESLTVPHTFSIGDLVLPGRNIIAIRVDNRMHVNVGKAHAVSEQTQTNWNGIIGRMEIRKHPEIAIGRVQVYPDLEARRARFRLHYRPNSRIFGSHYPTKVRITIHPAGKTIEDAILEREYVFNYNQYRTYADFTVNLGNELVYWDEFHPALYTVSIELETEYFGKTVRDEYSLLTGFREFATSGKQFTVNGQPTFLRGTLECAIFPLTGFPPMEKEEWLRIFSVVKAHGLNHMRFHSWCPPEAAFAAADQLGVYLQVEVPVWTVLGDGQPVDDFVYRESERILEWFGNHPSFCMMAIGNEPDGPEKFRFMGEVVEHWKKTDPRHLYTGSSGWGIIPENDFHSSPMPRLSSRGAGALEGGLLNKEPPSTKTDYNGMARINDIMTDWDRKTQKISESWLESDIRVPVVTHEMGQWCVYPDYSEIGKYTGVLKPRNLEAFRSLLQENGLGGRAVDFSRASGKLQAQLYKEEIEASLRTRDFGGFQLLDLHDFPGQGTALAGLLDVFWDTKGYITPEEFSAFCNATVPLSRMDKRVWTSGELFSAGLELAHYGAQTLENAKLEWSLSDKVGNLILQGEKELGSVQPGGLADAGRLEFPLKGMAAPARYTLHAELAGQRIRNSWDVWVFPEKLKVRNGSVTIAGALDEKTLSRLENGEKVLLLLAPDKVSGQVPMSFSTVFWCRQMFTRQKTQTLGMALDPDHPSLREFPTDFHADWQWWDLLIPGHASCMLMGDLPEDLQPVLQPIDDWNSNRRLGLLFEARAGKGRIMVCSIDLQNGMDQRPVARQLLHSLLEYMNSDAFDPKVSVNMKDIQGLIITNQP